MLFKLEDNAKPSTGVSVPCKFEAVAISFIPANNEIIIKALRRFVYSYTMSMQLIILEIVFDVFRIKIAPFWHI